MKRKFVYGLVLMAGAASARADIYAHVQTVMGDFNIHLYDTATPNTVANFVHYVTTDRYDGTFVHRHAQNFVLQMGGYSLDSNNVPNHIDEFAAINNEAPPGDPSTWPVERRNIERTVAMAKRGGDPNSATSEFFFNLADNSANLDYQNGGFTVFGYITSGWDVVQAITALNVIDAGIDPFRQLPVRNWDGHSNLTNDNLVVIQNVTIIPGPGTSAAALAGMVVAWRRRRP
jgi:cyclophilin family peptidyl-prolyl cis-trans isomerase